MMAWYRQPRHETDSSHAQPS